MLVEIWSSLKDIISDKLGLIFLLNIRIVNNKIVNKVKYMNL